jgi:hypothetical protein
MSKFPIARYMQAMLGAMLLGVAHAMMYGPSVQTHGRMPAYVIIFMIILGLTTMLSSLKVLVPHVIVLFKETEPIKVQTRTRRRRQ